MATSTEKPLVVSIAVEGPTDEAVAKKLLQQVGLNSELVFGNKGSSFLTEKIKARNQAAQHQPWLVLIDLDKSKECAPKFARELLPKPARKMCFRVAVREPEAWLLAEREALAAFLEISVDIIPRNPEGLLDPKEELINLARRSTNRKIKGMVPTPKSGRVVGPTYTTDVIDFVNNHWRPNVAGQICDSLQRCLKRLREWKPKQK